MADNRPSPKELSLPFQILDRRIDGFIREILQNFSFSDHTPRSLLAATVCHRNERQNRTNQEPQRGTKMSAVQTNSLVSLSALAAR